MPLSSRLPRSQNRSPDPATKSFTVCETRISVGPARAATRAATITAIPAAFFPAVPDFACVEAGPNLEFERPDRVHDRLRTLHPACGPVERGEDAVAGDVLLTPR